MLIFILKLDEPFRNEKIFIISLFFSKVQICVFLSKKCFFFEILVDILPLGSGSVGIFADPGSQNLADPTDSDPHPKHGFK